MAKGKVKWYNEAKGFGFIEVSDGEEVFVHRSGLRNTFDSLLPDQKVSFDITQGNKGPKATNVTSDY